MRPILDESFKAIFQQQVNLEDEAWSEIEKILVVKELKRKDHFLRQGEVCRHLGFILKGYVRLYYQLDGEEVTKDFNFENSFCGSYASFSLQQPSRFNVMAMETVHLLRISREDLYRLYDTYPQMQKLGRIRMEDMFIRKEMREASFLLDTAEERYQEMLRQYPKIEQRVPLKYLASYLGITAETLSRIRGNSR